MEFQHSLETDATSSGDELYCNEKPAFTPYPDATSPSRRKQKPLASTPYHPAQLSLTDKLDFQFAPSADDPVLDDPRVIQYMLQSETKCHRATSEYLQCTNVNDNMRKILLRWMYEVVMDQKCEDLIFVQSANYLDRFISSSPIQQGHLQLLGCCCLLLASKLRNCLIISAEVLADLTDGCHTEEEICNFELVVLAKLGWELSPVLPSDYLEPVLRQAGLDQVPHIRRHSTTFLSMTTLYSQFLDLSPSFVACSTLYAALTYCEGRADEEQRLLTFLSNTFNFSSEELAEARKLIFSSMNEEMSLQDEGLDSSAASHSDAGDTVSREADTTSYSSSVVSSSSSGKAAARSTAADDVSDAGYSGELPGSSFMSVSCSSSSPFSSSPSSRTNTSSWSPSAESDDSGINCSVNSCTSSTSSGTSSNTSGGISSNSRKTNDILALCVGDLTPSDIMDICIE